MSPFVKWLASPLSEWHTASLQHKALVGLSGGAVAWYLHQYHKWPVWKIALVSVAAAWGTSMVLNAASRFAVPALPDGAEPEAAVAPPPPSPPPPPQEVEPLDVEKAPDPLTGGGETTMADDGMSGNEGIFE